MLSDEFSDATRKNMTEEIFLTQQHIQRICGGFALENELPYRDYADVEYDKIKNTTPSIYVTDIVEFPTIQKTGDLKNTDEEIKLFRETVKKHIMKYGSVYSSIQSPSDISYSGLDNMNVFFTNGVSTDAERHAVSIIGWDDNYSKDNFKTELMNGEIATPKMMAHIQH